MQRFIIFLFGLGLMGCGGWGAGMMGSKVDPLPVRAGFRDDELVISQNIIGTRGGMGKRARSIVELREEVRFTRKKLDGGGSWMLAPNGIIFSLRARW